MLGRRCCLTARSCCSFAFISSLYMMWNGVLCLLYCCDRNLQRLLVSRFFATLELYDLSLSLSLNDNRFPWDCHARRVWYSFHECLCCIRTCDKHMPGKDIINSCPFSHPNKIRVCGKYRTKHQVIQTYIHSVVGAEAMAARHKQRRNKTS